MSQHPKRKARSRRGSWVQPTTSPEGTRVRGKRGGRGGCAPDVPMRILPAVPPRPDLCRAVRRTVLVSMRARSIEPVFCHSLIASRYGTAIISQTLFLILVNRYRTILKPLSNGSSIVEQDEL